MERLELDVVRRNFDDVLLLVGNGKQRVVVTEAGRDRAALISLEDLALLENLDGEHEIAVERAGAEDVRRHLHQDVDLVAGASERIVIRAGGDEVAALVPERDVTLLEQLDERLDIEAAKRMLEKKMREEAIDGED